MNRSLNAWECRDFAPVSIILGRQRWCRVRVILRLVMCMYLQTTKKMYREANKILVKVRTRVSSDSYFCVNRKHTRAEVIFVQQSCMGAREVIFREQKTEKKKKWRFCGAPNHRTRVCPALIALERLKLRLSFELSPEGGHWEPCWAPIKFVSLELRLPWVTREQRETLSVFAA